MTAAILDPTFKANMLAQLASGTAGSSLAASSRENTIQELLSSAAAIGSSQSDAGNFGELNYLLVKVLEQIAILGRYFEPEFKSALIKRVQDLLDPSEWGKEDAIPSAASFHTLLRLLVSINAERQPGLGIAPNGNFVAAWHDGDDRFFVEAAKNDLMKWVLSRTIESQKERASGEAKIHRFFEVTQAWRPEGYIAHASSNNRK